MLQLLSSRHSTDRYGALVQKWNSTLQAIYGGATLVVSRESTFHFLFGNLLVSDAF
jgi:hypothetical protein